MQKHLSVFSKLRRAARNNPSLQHKSANFGKTALELAFGVIPERC
jgi:hypothetical protein